MNGHPLAVNILLISGNALDEERSEPISSIRSLGAARGGVRSPI
jgi:hypothetical protein